MKKIFYIICSLFTLNSFAQNTVSIERLITPALVPSSIDTSGTIIISTAIPLIGTISAVHQSTVPILIPVDKSNNPIIQPSHKNQSIALPCITYTTSQASSLKLIPIETTPKNK